MKKLLFWICIAFVADVSAQMKQLKKWDSVNFNKDSTLVYVSKGKKSALVDIKENEVTFKKSKADILPLFDRDWYVKISKKGIVVYEHGTNMYRDGAEYLDGINGFSIRRLNTDNYLITDYGKNQFDTSGYLQLGFQKSGVYDKSLKKWVIPNQYKELYSIGDYWLCKKDDSVVTVSMDEEYYFPQEVFYGSYDIFQQSEKGWLKVKESIQDNQEAYQVLFGEGLFEQNETYLTIENEGQFGLIELDLFSPSENGYPFLKHDTILEVKHQFVQVAPDHSAIALLDKSNEIHFLEWNEELEGFDENSEVSNPFLMTKIYDRKWKKSQGKFEHLYYGGDLFKFGFYLNDKQDLIVINEHIFYPYEKLDEYGEPAFDWETGDMLFEDNGAVHPKCGVYSLNENKWLIKPEYGEIKNLPNGYLVRRYNSQNMNGKRAEFDDDWCLFDSKGQLGKVVEEEQFYAQINQFVAGHNMEEVEMPGEMDPRGAITEAALFQDSSGMKLIRWEDDYFAPCEMTESRFIYSAHPRQYWAAVDSSNNWQLNLNDQIVQMRISDQINLMIKSPYGGECFEVSRLTVKDTILITEKVIEQCDKNRNAAHLQLQKLHNGDLLINDHFRYEEEVYDNWGDVKMNYVDESEGSAIWRKTAENKWARVTPYYASLSKSGNVFIAKSVEYSGNFVYEEGGEGYVKFNEMGEPEIEGKKEARFFVLDSNYKAISFLDHYDFNHIEDLGFGLSLSTDKGKMFVDYSGQAITTDEWEGFEFQGDQIRAYRNVQMPYRIYREPELQQYYEVIIPQPFQDAYYNLNQDR